MFGKRTEKDLEPEGYFDWRDRVVKTMKLWINKKLSEAEFLNVVKELD